MSGPRGRKSRPTSASSTEDFPEDCDPTTAIWGSSKSPPTFSTPACVKISWSLLIKGTRPSPKVFWWMCAPGMVVRRCQRTMVAGVTFFLFQGVTHEFRDAFPKNRTAPERQIQESVFSCDRQPRPLESHNAHAREPIWVSLGPSVRPPARSPSSATTTTWWCVPDPRHRRASTSRANLKPTLKTPS